MVAINLILAFVLYFFGKHVARRLDWFEYYKEADWLMIGLFVNLIVASLLVWSTYC